MLMILTNEVSIRKSKMRETGHLRVRLIMKRQEREKAERILNHQDLIPVLRKKSPRGTSPSGKTKQECCREWKASGTCKRGDKCNYWHAPPCKFHAKGECKAGNACSWPHRNGNASSKKKADQPSAGLAVGLPAQRRSQSLDFAGGDPCALYARGDPGRKVSFPDDLHKVAQVQENRRKRKRTCASWPRYNPPDPDEPEQ